MQRICLGCRKPGRQRELRCCWYRVQIVWCLSDSAFTNW